MRSDGSFLSRFATRRFWAGLSNEPPRFMGLEPVSARARPAVQAGEVGGAKSMGVVRGEVSELAGHTNSGLLFVALAGPERLLDGQVLAANLAPSIRPRPREASDDPEAQKRNAIADSYQTRGAAVQRQAQRLDDECLDPAEKLTERTALAEDHEVVHVPEVHR